MIYALLGAVAWAALDGLRKRLSNSVDVFALSAWLNGGAVPAFLLWAGWSGAGWPDEGYLLPGLGVLGIGLLAQLLFLLALRWAGLARTIPMLALTPAIASFVAWLVLGEVPTAREGGGLVLIVVGCLANGVLAARERPSEGVPHPVRGMLAMASVAVLWSVTGVVDKVALRHAAPASHATFVVLGTLLALIGLLVARGRLRDLVPAPGDRLPLFGAVGTLGLAYGLQLLAISAIAVGLVEGVKRGVGVPAALFTGWAFFGESVSKGRQVAALVVVMGLVLVQGSG
jgi:drug/metabolite transporter (DMT)-like permease